MKMTKLKGNMISEKEKKSSDFQCQGVSQNESSYVNSQCIRKQKKEKLKLRKQRIYKKKSHGLWTTHEEAQFLQYMKKFQNIFEDKELRRAERIFKKMSKFMKTRSPDQCRSHHQKYQIRFGDYEGIVNYIQSKLLQEGYQESKLLVKVQNSLDVRSKSNQKDNQHEQFCQKILPLCSAHSNLENTRKYQKNLGQKTFAKYQKQGQNSIGFQLIKPFASSIHQQCIDQWNSKVNLGENNISIKLEEIECYPIDLDQPNYNLIQESFQNNEKKQDKASLATGGGFFSKTREQYEKNLNKDGFQAKAKEQRGVDIYMHQEKPQIVLLLSYEEFFDSY